VDQTDARPDLAFDSFIGRSRIADLVTKGQKDGVGAVISRHGVVLSPPVVGRIAQLVGAQ